MTETMKERITIEGRDGAFGVYIARPTSVTVQLDCDDLSSSLAEQLPD
jgi:hypothetical protein